MTDPKTLPELLDAARDGQEFAAALLAAFRALETARKADDD